LEIKKGTIKPFISKFFSKDALKKTVTINSENKGVLRGILVGATIAYIISPSHHIIQEYDIDSNNFTEVEIINEQIVGENKFSYDDIKKEVLVKKIVKKEPNHLEELLSIDEKDIQAFMLGQLPDDEMKKIERLINIEANNKIYRIDSLPQDVVAEITKSAILYQIGFKDKSRMFDEEEDFRKKIAYTSALLASVAKLETGTFKYDHREFSPTGAYGRFQIVASTASSIIFKLYMDEGFDISKKDKDMTTTAYNMLKDYTSEINDEYASKYDEEWKGRTEQRQFKRYLRYTKVLNYNYIKSLDGTLRHMHSQDGHSASQVKKDLFYSHGKISKYKEFKFSLKVLDFLKQPENQGVLSCFVLEEIYKRMLKKYPHRDMEEILYITLKKYNNDRATQYYKGKKKEVRQIYAEKGIKYYRKNIRQLTEQHSEEQELLDLEASNDSQEKKSPTIKELFAKI